MQIFDSLHVIAIGGDPEYGASQVLTTDGGETWEYTNLGVYWFPVNMGFRNVSEGWAPLGGQSKFLYTSDSGENWAEIITPDSTDVITYLFSRFLPWVWNWEKWYNCKIYLSWINKCN